MKKVEKKYIIFLIVGIILLLLPFIPINIISKNLNVLSFWQGAGGALIFLGLFFILKNQFLK
ncbi:hypothetical protein [Frigoriflavimonas asaccharolytica]|uniref:Uncharacterized protein n=1 Tax=Frigoriflavimonas asaccharolytica TaxID=2735899 RepID=A0A8J8G9B3_9FLAO|nr:hypothetical protein [Frigoriflavimonas asaccharolytica]NRS93503.1 hypothetical protein [Frigoriflavimonas asaccharolytica]